MTRYVNRSDLSVAAPIAAFAESSLERFGIGTTSFWTGVSEIVHEFGQRSVALLRTRDELQHAVDEFHKANPGVPDELTYREFLTRIGYLQPAPEPFSISTQGVDPEVSTVAGPQLVVPLLNARFAVNAANARWGSLYDAVYGTDVISTDGALAPGPEYNQVRGNAVVSYGRAFLDSFAHLDHGHHSEALGYSVDENGLVIAVPEGNARLSRPELFAGYVGERTAPTAVLLRSNGLHVELSIDRTGTVGAQDAAGIQDIVLESAITTIMDLEDSVAAVNADDKALGYLNWRELMDATLTVSVTKGSRTFTRSLNPDRTYTSPSGRPLVLPGRSILFIRNVGHLMTSDAVLDRDGAEVFEGVLDAIMTVLGSLGDLRGERAGGNSRTGSVYIVKPKMHGPEEVAFTVELFDRVEELLRLPSGTIKLGIMDEERRTSVNLSACIRVAADRVAFINTGFLDRTGDEIHTSLHAGPMLPKRSIRRQPFMAAYEARNVGIGIDAGFEGRAQIGKGMWAMPDMMRDMLDQKISHVKSGASTAWVPSPTAATLHALHYHQVDAFAARRKLSDFNAADLDALLTIPLAPPGSLTPDIVSTELDSNVQSILGYVVRWINQGIGCSKVPDIDGTALMEDRATLRISSQLLANWLTHRVINVDQVEESLARLARIVDSQNAEDTEYEPLTRQDGTTAIAYRAARQLILEGAAQPNGYTEPLLHALRKQKLSETAGGRQG